MRPDTWLTPPLTGPERAALGLLYPDEVVIHDWLTTPSGRAFHRIRVHHITGFVTMLGAGWSLDEALHAMRAGLRGTLQVRGAVSSRVMTELQLEAAHRYCDKTNGEGS